MTSLGILKVVLSHPTLLPSLGLKVDKSGCSTVQEWLTLAFDFFTQTLLKAPRSQNKLPVCSRTLKTFKIFSHPHPLPKEPLLPARTPCPHSLHPAPVTHALLDLTDLPLPSYIGGTWCVTVLSGSFPKRHHGLLSSFGFLRVLHFQ